MGWVRYRQERYDEAAEYLEIAISLKQDLSSAYCILAHTKESLGDDMGALVYWEDCLRYSADDIPEQDMWIYYAQNRLKGEE
jgi:hypothetical protein